MNERLIHLRIKIKSLVDESKNIRKEANKTSGMAKWRLQHHRTTVVRRHTRENLLAYGILRGVPYSAIEKKCYARPNFKMIIKHAKEFGGVDEEISAWVEDAQEYLSGKREELKLAS